MRCPRNRSTHCHPLGRETALPYPLHDRTRALAAVTSLAGCDMLDMYDQPRYKPLARCEFFPDGMSARPLVAGTIARGQLEEDWRSIRARSMGGTSTNCRCRSTSHCSMRPRAIYAVLLDVPRPDRLRQRHGRAARIQAAAIVPQRGVRGLAAGNFFKSSATVSARCPPSICRPSRGIAGRSWPTFAHCN